MRRIRIEYDSPLDAFVAISKRLNAYEGRYKMESEEFFCKYEKGEAKDTADFVDWANDYQHYISIRHDLEMKLRYVA